MSALNALKRQIGGSHYKDFKIQPVEFCEVNQLSHLESNIVKRICRYKKINNSLTDLKKIQHEIDLLIDIHSIKDKVGAS